MRRRAKAVHPITRTAAASINLCNTIWYNRKQARCCNSRLRDTEGVDPSMQDQRITKRCVQCGEDFKIKRSRVAAGRGSFCGMACKRATEYNGQACNVDICERPAWNRGWCRMHYQRWFRCGNVEGKPRVSISPANRLWSRVDKNGPIPEYCPDLGPCWLWTGPVNGSGYGTIGVGSRVIGAHVLAYELLVGPLPNKMEPDHLCRVKRCVNAVRHLEAVTKSENRRRAQLARRLRTQP